MPVGLIKWLSPLFLLSDSAADDLTSLGVPGIWAHLVGIGYELLPVFQGSIP